MVPTFDKQLTHDQHSAFQNQLQFITRAPQMENMHISGDSRRLQAYMPRLDFHDAHKPRCKYNSNASFRSNHETRKQSVFKDS